MLRQLLIGGISILTNLLVIIEVTTAQKKAITINTYKTWESVQDGKISNDGQFVVYSISNRPILGFTSILRKVNPDTEIEFRELKNPRFTEDSKFLIGDMNNDTTLIYDLLNKRFRKIPHCLDFNVITLKDQTIIAYIDGYAQKFVLAKLSGQIIFQDDSIQSYIISNSNKVILLNQKTNSNQKERYTVKWLDLISYRSRIIYNCSNVASMIINNQDNRASIFSKDQEGNYIVNYFLTKNIIDTIKSASFDELSNKYNYNFSNNIFRYSTDGASLFFTVTEKSPTNEYSDLEGLHIWDYKDSYLKSQFYLSNGMPKSTKSYLCTFDLNKGISHRLVFQGEEITPNTFTDSNENYFVVESTFGNPDEKFIPTSKVSYTIISIKTGRRFVFEHDRNSRILDIKFCPKGNYLSYYDPDQKGYIIYNMKLRSKINITKGTNIDLIRYDQSSMPNPDRFIVGNSFWLKSGDAIIINASYDMYAFNVENINRPINLTEKANENSKTIFNIAGFEDKKNVHWKSNIIVSGFNTISKQYRYYRLKVDPKPSLTPLYVGDDYYNSKGNCYAGISVNNLQKSKDADRYLILKESTNNAPNYFFTRDLKKLEKISNIQPQADYVWLNSSLQTYWDSAGIEYQGILYLPENFDSTKKYPVVFQCYELQTSRLNEFPSIELPGANISIPLAVSNGYIVFLPDIHSQIGRPGDGALKSVLAAAQYLSKFHYIDVKNMAISGHSFGGFETNYIITETNIFKAAISGAGTSEIISMAYSLWESHGSATTGFYLNSSPKLAASLADDPQLYVKNSPLLKVSRVNTPLLLVHNKGDMAVPYRQSRQLFIALRSLRKPVWLLSYDNESHTITDDKNKENYNQKILEFLDHYLKNKQIPKWMSMPL